jgi:acyl-CoA hydrolase
VIVVMAGPLLVGLMSLLAVTVPVALKVPVWVGLTGTEYTTLPPTGRSPVTMHVSVVRAGLMEQPAHETNTHTATPRSAHVRALLGCSQQ